MNHVYCHGRHVPLIERDGWFWCGGCGKNIWRTDQTFRLEGSGVPSHHGYNREEDVSQVDERSASQVPAGTVSVGAAEAGHA